MAYNGIIFLQLVGLERNATVTRVAQHGNSFLEADAVYRAANSTISHT